MFRISSIFLSLALLSSIANAKLITEEVSYNSGNTNMNGYIAYDDSIKGKRPGILVVHEWWGHNDYSRTRTEMLAKLGYTAIAIDMYGDGKTANHPKGAKALAMGAKKDMSIAEDRFNAALTVLKGHKSVNSEQVSAIGYCFGGGIVLDMLRRGLEIDLAGIFHGGLKTNNPAKIGSLNGTKVMVFNGADDRSIKIDHIQDFVAEMTSAKANLTLVNYPNTVHAFTNPEATKLGKKFNFSNLAYNQEADKDSWKKFTNALNGLY